MSFALIYLINFQTSPYNLLSACKLYDLQLNFFLRSDYKAKKESQAVEENRKLSIA